MTAVVGSFRTKIALEGRNSLWGTNGRIKKGSEGTEGI